MSYKGKTRHWFIEFLWDLFGTLVIGIALAGICLCALWVAGQLFFGVIGE